MRVKRSGTKSDLKKVDRVREEQIDYSEIPELDDAVFAQPLVEWPPKKETITMRVDSDVLGWFKQQGSGYQTRMNLVLRHYMEVTRTRIRPKRPVRKTSHQDR
jgi:uncharacterized protein (DUF4415 family)